MKGDLETLTEIIEYTTLGKKIEKKETIIDLK